MPGILHHTPTLLLHSTDSITGRDRPTLLCAFQSSKEIVRFWLLGYMAAGGPQQGGGGGTLSLWHAMSTSPNVLRIFFFLFFKFKLDVAPIDQTAQLVHIFVCKGEIETLPCNWDSSDSRCSSKTSIWTARSVSDEASVLSSLSVASSLRPTNSLRMRSRSLSCGVEMMMQLMKATSAVLYSTVGASRSSRTTTAKR